LICFFPSNDAAKSWPNTDHIEPQPSTTQFGRHVAQPQHQRHRIANRPTLLIDDVMTTGVILYEAAKPFIGREVAQFAGWS
jgi:predicted amidophosphoribosyltransferase